MKRKIPGVELLIAFETAARHQSFTRAAEELSLTQSAVCRQIAALEDYLGVALFNRVRRRVLLSEAGRLYARQVRENLKRIEHDTLSLMAHRGSGVLELAAIPTFASRWLIPRLVDFHASHPNIGIDLTTRAEPFMFNDTPFDAAIHFGDPIWPGAVIEYLFGEEMIPVCNPGLMHGQTRIEPEKLAKMALLHQSSRPEAWRQWFDMMGVRGVNVMGGPRYELFSMLIPAAQAGLGVALVPHFFVQKELASGELVSPCPVTLSSQRGYYLVYPEDRAGSASLQAFGQWLHGQAEAYRSEMGAAGTTGEQAANSAGNTNNAV